MIILALQDVRKSFGTHEVLKSVSFTLQEGERMGLVGVNGSGKSTMMKIIAGLESADSGSVNMQKGLRIGYLAQQGELTGDETVQETLESVFEPQRRMEAELRSLEQEMAVSGSEPETAISCSSARISASMRLWGSKTLSRVSSTVSSPVSSPCWARYPIRSPFWIFTLPLSAVSCPVMIFIRVLLPLPLTPTMPIRSPS